MKYVHTNIITKDWNRLADFYINTFQCKIVPPIRNQKGTWLDRGLGLKNAHLQGAHLRLPGYGDKGPTLEIYQYDPVIDQSPLAPNHRGYGHIAFEVDNVHEVVTIILANGGSINGEVTVREVEGVGVLTFVYARDPDGNLVEVQNWEK